MKKKQIAVLLVVMTLCTMLFGISASSAAAATPKLYVNNQLVSAKLYSKSSHIMLPVRLIMEETGYEYRYSKNKVTIYAGSETITFTRGSKYYYDNGSKTTLKVASELKYSMIYAPYTFFTDIMGLTVAKGSDGNYYVSDGSSTATATPTPAVTATTSNIRVNGVAVGDMYYTDSAGTVYVPLKSVSGPLGYTFSQSGVYGYITRNNVTTAVEVGKTDYSIGGVRYYLNKPVTASGDKIYVPSQFLQTAMNSSPLLLNNVLELYTDNSGVATNSADIRINNVLLGVKGYIASNGMGYVPLKEVGQALGYTYTSSTATAQLARAGVESVMVEVYKDTVTRVSTSGINTYNMGYNTEWTNNQIYVPIRLLSNYLSGVLVQTSGSIIYISTTGSITTGTTGATKNVVVSGTSYTGYAYTRTVVNGTSTYIALTGDIFSALGATLSTSGNDVTITHTGKNIVIKTTVGTNSYTVTKSGSTTTQTSSSASEWSVGTLYVPMDVVSNSKFLGCAIYPENDSYYVYK